MNKAGTNEKMFKEIIKLKFGKVLKGKKFWKDSNSDVSISVDETIETKDFNLLIEIDSGNYAKLIAGQYTLLNILFKNENIQKTPIFIIIHFYNRNTDKPYNSDRTYKNLGLINSKVFNKNGMSFLAFNLHSFKEYIENFNSLDELNESLKNHYTITKHSCGSNNPT